MHVLVVEDIIDTGLTLSYLISNLLSRNPASLKIMTAFRKPDAEQNAVEVAYVGFDIPNEFVVGYGLDYDGRYRNLTSVGAALPARLLVRFTASPRASLIAPARLDERASRHAFRRRASEEDARTLRAR